MPQKNEVMHYLKDFLTQVQFVNLLNTAGDVRAPEEGPENAEIFTALPGSAIDKVTG